MSLIRTRGGGPWSGCLLIGLCFNGGCSSEGSNPARDGETTGDGDASTGAVSGGGSGAASGGGSAAGGGELTASGGQDAVGSGSSAATGSASASGGADNQTGSGGTSPSSGGEAATTGTTDPDPNPSGPTRAFPGAQGFGRDASGGRGGQVVHVTNLNDSGVGSFRDAVSESDRIVVFDVGGVIQISDRIVVKKNIHVAGQSAPGDGITIYGNGLAFNGDSGNNIIRYLRVRMGKNGDSGKDAVAISEGQNYMFDHVSISWGRDGTLDVNGTGVDNLSFQDTIIGQGINSSNHSTGGLMQSGKWSVIRSLYADNKTRNPKARGTHEFINSVLYNWGTHGYIMGDTSGISECNLIGNYFIYGPSSDPDSHITDTTPSFFVYAKDNWIDANKNGSLDGSLFTNYKTATLANDPFDYPAGSENHLSAADAVAAVIDQVGASLVRDEVDKLLIEQMLSFGTSGSIINTEDDNNISNNVGKVAGGSSPEDFDRDGMPDEWESENGFDPAQPDDAGDDDTDGYSNIEEYLSCLVGEGDC